MRVVERRGEGVEVAYVALDALHAVPHPRELVQGRLRGYPHEKPVKRAPRACSHSASQAPLNPV